MISVRRRADEGFTLVELLIAIVIMGISIGVFVLALGSLSVATENHRGHSVNETVTRDFAEAVSAKASFATTLAAAVTDPSADFICTKADPSEFGSTVVGMYLVVDSETVRVTDSPGNCTAPAPVASFKLKVDRGVGSIAGTHVVDTRVRQLTACADATTASSGNNPSWIGYLNPDGYSPPSGISATITNVSYLNAAVPATPTYDWTQGQCWTYFKNHCQDPSSAIGPPSQKFDLLPECDPGLVLITVTVADTNVGDGATVGSTSCANGAICTTTKMLVRRGGH